MVQYSQRGSDRGHYTKGNKGGFYINTCIVVYTDVQIQRQTKHAHSPVLKVDKKLGQKKRWTNLAGAVTLLWICISRADLVLPAWSGPSTYIPAGGQRALPFLLILLLYSSPGCLGPPVWYQNIVTTNDTLLLLLQILHLSLSSTILGWFKSNPRLLLSSGLHSLFHPALSLQVWYSYCKCPFKCYPECSNHISQLFCLIPNIPFTSNKGFLPHSIKASHSSLIKLVDNNLSVVMSKIGQKTSETHRKSVCNVLCVQIKDWGSIWRSQEWVWPDARVPGSSQLASCRTLPNFIPYTGPTMSSLSYPYPDFASGIWGWSRLSCTLVCIALFLHSNLCSNDCAGQSSVTK